MGGGNYFGERMQVSGGMRMGEDQDAYLSALRPADVAVDEIRIGPVVGDEQRCLEGVGVLKQLPNNK